MLAPACWLSTVSSMSSIPSRNTVPFSEEHHHFRRVVREYITEEIGPRVEQWETDEIIPLHDVFADMAKLGLLGLEYETEYGAREPTIYSASSSPKSLAVPTTEVSAWPLAFKLTWPHHLWPGSARPSRR